REGRHGREDRRRGRGFEHGGVSPRRWRQRSLAENARGMRSPRSSFGAASMKRALRRRRCFLTCRRTKTMPLSWNVAEAYTFRTEHDLAFERLERAYAQRDPGIVNTKGSSLLASLRSDPHWQTLAADDVRRTFLEKVRLAA